MSQAIHRMYDSHERATRAAAELAADRFGRFTEVFVCSQAAGSGASADEIVASLMKAHVLKAHARVYAERVLRGQALVTVHAPFGAALTALNMLQRHGPADSGVADAMEPYLPWDEGTPLSNLLGLRVLLADSDTFSRFWNVPALSRQGATTSSALGLPELSASRGPFTGTFGLSLISHKATPLSSLLGLPVLKK